METTPVNIRFPDALLAELDAWRAAQPVAPSRTATILEAVRRLIGCWDKPNSEDGWSPRKLNKQGGSK